MVATWIIALGTAIVGIWNGVKEVGSKALDLARDLFNFLLEMFKTFLSTAPKGVKILFFLFFILTIANVVVGFFVQTNFACLDGELREYDGIVGGFRGYWESIGEDLENSTTDYENYINNNTFTSDRFGDGTEHTDLLNVRCFGNTPRLSFFKLDFLNYQFWLLLVILGVLFSIRSKRT